jgi:hypothetical protein
MITPSAIQDQLRVRVGDHFLYITFQYPLAEMDSFGGMALLPFVVLSHIDQNGGRVFAQTGTGFIHGYLLHLRTSLVD